MPCKTFSKKSFGEKADKRPPFSHRILCSVCRAEARRASKLAKRAANLPRLAPPDPLRDRTLALLADAPTPDASPLTTPLRKGTKGKIMLFPISPRWASGLAAAAVVSVSVVAGALWYAPAVSAKSIRNAIEAANTWHFTGWRLQGQKKAPWEVWGRRAPFFYRERIGDEILTDDGAARIRILPPNALRPKGVVLKMKSEAGLMQASGRDGLLVGLGGEFWGRVSSPKRDGDLIRFEGHEKMYGSRQVDERTAVWVNPSTRLPVRYAIEQEIHQAPDVIGEPGVKPVESVKATAELDAAYNVELPEKIETVAAPSGYDVTDFTEVFGRADLPNDNIASQNGVTIEGRAVSQDAEGNLKLGFTPYVGNKRYRFAVTPFHIDVSGDNGIAGVAAKDDLGNQYIPVGLPLGMATDSENPEMYLVPLEPFKPNAPRPKSLTITLQVSVGTLEAVEEIRSNRVVDLNNARMTLTLPLTQKVTPSDYDTRPNSRGVSYVGIKPTLAMQAAQSRALAYQVSSSTVEVNMTTGERRVLSDTRNPERARYWNLQGEKESLKIGARRWAQGFRASADAIGQ